jgi:DNA-binding transcriptional MerR regulator
MTHTPPPDDPVWASIRLRYEQDQETVSSIATDVDMAGISLARLAKKLGWALRGKAKQPLKPVEPAKSTKPEATSATIKRVKDVLQQRLAELEAQVKDIGEEVTSLNTERQIRSANILVRTLEKVMDLERKDRLRRRKETRDFKYFNDEQREQLAGKIARLQRTWRSDENLDQPIGAGSGGTEQPVALLGKAQPTAAAQD